MKDFIEELTGKKLNTVDGAIVVSDLVAIEDAQIQLAREICFRASGWNDDFIFDCMYLSYKDGHFDKYGYSNYVELPNLDTFYADGFIEIDTYYYVDGLYQSENKTYESGFYRRSVSIPIRAFGEQYGVFEYCINSEVTSCGIKYFETESDMFTDRDRGEFTCCAEDLFINEFKRKKK